MGSEQVAIEAQGMTAPEASVVSFEGACQGDQNRQARVNDLLQVCPEAASPDVLENSVLNPTRPSFLAEFRVLEAWFHTCCYRFEQIQTHLVIHENFIRRHLHGIHHSDKYGKQGQLPALG